MFTTSKLWYRQTYALTRKIFLVSTKHWISTLIRCLIIPIVILTLVLEIQNFSPDRNKYGVGSPSPFQSLSDSLPNDAKLVFVQPPHLGSDVHAVIKKIRDPLSDHSWVEVLQDDSELLEHCPTSHNGATRCYAAITFNDSPLSTSGDAIWNYTLRVSSSRMPSTFDVSKSNARGGNVYGALQLAVENAMTNSTTIPETFMFTHKNKEQVNAQKSRSFASSIIGGLNIVCFLSMASSIFHVSGMIATERELGMTQLIDVMTGGAASARVLSYIIAFDVIYFPCWLIFGGLYASLLSPSCNPGITILWQVLSGWAMTSASVFCATVSIRYSAIYITVVFILLAALTQYFDEYPDAITVPFVLAFSAFFPSSNFVFFLNLLSRFEKQSLAMNVFEPAPNSDDGTYDVTASMLWGMSLLSIVGYSVLAIMAETYIHGVSNKGRIFSKGYEVESRSDSLEVDNLTKQYPPSLFKRLCCCFCPRSRPTTAVDGLSFSSQNNQVLCMLGVNGSGKTTTMDLITGLQRATSGTIRINASSSKIGLCPQRNVHWETLSVFDHAYLWTMLKNGSVDTVLLEQLIDSCDLTPKRDSTVGTLSGGQKRKVQMLCMLAGGSSICLMDEVTTGMDPVSRRAVWNIVLAERSKRSIIFTTHFLDECEILADHVVVISQGQLKCQGTVAALKNLHGGGYRVQLPVETPPSTPYPMTFSKGQAVFSAPDSASAAHILSYLESAGFSGPPLLGPKMEDVFLNVAGERNQTDELERTGTGSCGAHLALIDARSNLSDAQLSSSREVSFFHQVLALLIKRLLVLKTGFLWYILALTIPLAFMPVFISIFNSSGPFQPMPCANLQPSVLDDPYSIQLPSGTYNEDFDRGNFSLLLAPRSTNATLSQELSSYPFGEEFERKNYAKSFEFEDNLNSFLHRIRSKTVHIDPGAVFLGDKSSPATFAYDAEQSDASILMQNIWSQLRNRIPIAMSFGYFSSTIPSDENSGLLFAILLAALHTVYPAFFALYPTYERVSKVRALQYSNSVRPCPLWVSYILVDLLFILVISGLSTLILSQTVINWYHVGYMFPIQLLYGLAAMLWAYLLSLYAPSELAAFGLTLCTTLATFIISTIAFTLVDSHETPDNRNLLMDTTSFALGLIFPMANVVRAIVVGLNVWAVGCRGRDLIGNPASIHAYGGPTLLLGLQVLYLFGLLLCLDGQWPLESVWKRLVTRSGRHNENGENGELNIELALSRTGNPQDSLLQISRVCKAFRGKVAVEDASLSLGKSEILGLLGPNGAGKTTITNMIRGEIQPDEGTISINGVEVQTNKRAALRHIGVCPQFDALDRLNVKQQLLFYARIKGIDDPQRDVDVVIRQVGLAPFSSRLTSKLSGGNKRKLSLAIALLGNPAVLVLDEPSSAMDAISKRDMWKMLSSISSGRSILLTTHSMEEADRLSTKLAILSKKILASGTSQELRKQHRDVYEVHLVLTTSPASSIQEMQYIEAWVQEKFPHATFGGVSLGGQVRFVIPAHGAQSTNKRMGISHLIHTLEECKDSIGIAYYTVSMATLESVFLKVMEESNLVDRI